MWLLFKAILKRTPDKNYIPAPICLNAKTFPLSYVSIVGWIILTANLLPVIATKKQIGDRTGKL